MKKHIKFLKFILVGLLICSCSDDDDDGKPVEIATPGAFAYLETRTISVFDVDAALNVDLFTKNDLSFETLSVENNGTKVADVAIDGATGTFNSSSLLPFEFGDDDKPTGAFNLDFIYSLSDGASFASKNQNLEVTKAISLSNEVNSYIINDTLNTSIVYALNTKEATVDDVIVTYKVGSEGMEVTIDDRDFNVKKDSINFKDGAYRNYNLTVGDTLFYKFTATSGTLTDSVETSVVFTP